MILESFRVTGLAIGQIVLLGAIGYTLVKRGTLKEEGLSVLSQLVVEVTLPALIFCQLIKDFTFSIYPDWWAFPILSIAITIAGLVLGWVFSVFVKGGQRKLQFTSLVGFQNSAYLPLVLIAAILPKEQVSIMFVYLFLFLLWFNLVIWSFGVYMLTFVKAKKFELSSLFSPPVIATLFSLVFIYFGFQKFVPEFVFKPLKAVGDCTVPMAMFVVSGNLAQIKLEHIEKKAVFLILLAKLIILPLAGVLISLKLINK